MPGRHCYCKNQSSNFLYVFIPVSVFLSAHKLRTLLTCFLLRKDIIKVIAVHATTRNDHMRCVNSRQIREIDLKKSLLCTAVGLISMTTSGMAADLELVLGSEGTFPPFSIIGADGRPIRYGDGSRARDVCKSERRMQDRFNGFPGAAAIADFGQS